MGRNGKDVDFLAQLEMAEQRDAMYQQRQIQYPQAGYQQDQQHYHNAQPQLNWREQQHQSQLQMMMREQQHQDEMQARQAQQRPRGILKSASPQQQQFLQQQQHLSYQQQHYENVQQHPPQTMGPAAGGYNRQPQDLSRQLTDYTTSRVLQAPGGNSSFTLTDGSAQADERFHPPRQQPQQPQQPHYQSQHQPGGRRGGNIALGASIHVSQQNMAPIAGKVGQEVRRPSPPRQQVSADMPAAGSGTLHGKYHCSNDGQAIRRDPNASSTPGGIFFG